MIFGQDRDELRRMYADAWRKRCAGEPLSPLESQIARVIEDHPEYHAMFADFDPQAEYTVEQGETNPFLHMGLHLAIRDQVATDRPAGVRTVYESLCAKLSDRHTAEHRMLDCLAESLWESQSSHAPPDEQQYLERVKRLLKRSGSDP